MMAPEQFAAVPTPHAAAAAPTQGTRTDPPPAVAIAEHGDDEAVMLRREGLPSDGVILAPSVAATPMRHPENAWAMLVLAADVLDDTDPDREGEVALFAGRWLPEQPPATQCEGNLVLALTAPEGDSPPDDLVDVEMLLAHRNRWARVGEWAGVDARWPWTVAMTAAAIIGLHTEVTETTSPASRPQPTA
ncbi:hypothetical protein [Actinokineospora sp. HUAS TT18]|uniref:hypothetical protein n=1 Tax=Actinokineospora sp. HUAS TT18 TaxID=3447451 RepID=UPI003F524195